MTPIGVFGFLLSVAALVIISGRMTIAKLVISFFLLLAHIGASIYYYQYSLTAVADASGYYFDPSNLAAQPFGLGATLVAQICHFLKVSFGASYLDCFLIFQSFGFAGLMLLARTFEEIETSVGVPDRRGYWILLFLPSVNFWTSAIGKDAPMFFAVALCGWAMLNFRTRVIYFCVSLALMVLFRAHVALMAALALAATSVFGSSVSMGRKMAFMAIALVGIWFAGGAVETTIGVDPMDPASVNDYLNDQSAVLARTEGTTSIGSAIFPVRLLSLLFRPLFFDAHGALGIIASVENAAFIVVFLAALVHFRDFRQLFQRVPFIRFVVLFAGIMIVLLAMVYYNVGLGLRERVMAYPLIFSIMVAMWSMRRKPHSLAGSQPANSLMVKPNPNRPVAEL